MNLQRLHYFSVVAEELNFTRAAKRLHLAQPSLSQQVRKLEREIGGALLLRDTHGVELTPAGAVLADRARRLVDDYEATIHAARTMTAPTTRPAVTVGVFTAALGPVTSLVVKALPPALPALNLTVTPLDYDFEEKLGSGAVDVAVVRLPVRSRFATEPIYADQRTVVVANGFRHFDADNIDASCDAAPIRTFDPTGTLSATNIEAWCCPPERNGNPLFAAGTDHVHHLLDGLGYVLSGRGAMPASTSLIDVLSFPGLRSVPVVNASPAWCGVAWRPEHTAPAITDTVTAIRALAWSLRDLVPDATFDDPGQPARRPAPGR